MMKKIEPAAWMWYPRKKPELSKPSLNKSLPVALKGSGWISDPLYTSEAIEAVAEAVHRTTMAKFYLHIMSGDERDMPERIDLSSIISQLTGD